MPAPEPSLISDTKRIVLVIQGLLREATRPYTTYANLKADLKDKLARLRLPYDAGLIDHALDRLELGGQRPVVGEETKAPNHRDPDLGTISREEVSRLVQQIRSRAGVVAPVKTIASAPWSDPVVSAQEETDARQRAAEIGVLL